MGKTAIYSITTGVSANTLNVKEIWKNDKSSGSFCPDYTTLCSFTISNNTYILGYNGKQQNGDIYQLNPSGDGLTLKQQTPLDQEYDIVQFFPVAAEPHILAYDKASGKIDFYRIAKDLTLIRLTSYRRTYGTVTQGFTTVIPYNYHGTMLFLGYNGTNGNAVIYQISVTAETPLHIDEIWSKKWATDWTRFAFFKMGGENFFLKSNPKHKNVNIDHMVDNPVQGSHPVGTHLPLELDLEAVATFEFSHWPYFATYRTADGAATCNRLYCNCLGWDTEATFTAVEGAKHIIPLQHGDKTYLMIY